MRFATATLLILLATVSARGDQVTADFEGLAPGHKSGFGDAGFSFSNTYSASGDYFTGFAVSKEVNNVPIDSPNDSKDYDLAQFGVYAPAAPGTGFGGSAGYGIAYNYFVGDAVITLPTGADPVSLELANTTYAASFLLYGDKFGSPIAQGQYFRVEVVGLDASGNPIAAAPVSTTLADDPDGTPDVRYGFQFVNLSSLKGAVSLGFNIETNIVDPDSGFATVPFTFAVDNVVAATPSAVPEPSTWVLAAFGVGGLGRLARRRRVGSV